MRATSKEIIAGTTANDVKFSEASLLKSWDSYAFSEFIYIDMFSGNFAKAPEHATHPVTKKPFD